MWENRNSIQSTGAKLNNFQNETMHSKEEKLNEFGRLLEIMSELRQKCPWDKEQTFESLRTLTIEETYELADAIIKEDKKEIKIQQIMAAIRE